jgi:hypothetical protein
MKGQECSSRMAAMLDHRLTLVGLRDLEKDQRLTDPCLTRSHVVPPFGQKGCAYIIDAVDLSDTGSSVQRCSSAAGEQPDAALHAPLHSP